SWPSDPEFGLLATGPTDYHVGQSVPLRIAAASPLEVSVTEVLPPTAATLSGETRVSKPDDVPRGRADAPVSLDGRKRRPRRLAFRPCAIIFQLLGQLEVV